MNKYKSSDLIYLKQNYKNNNTYCFYFVLILELKKNEKQRYIALSDTSHVGYYHNTDFDEKYEYYQFTTTKIK